MSTLFLISAVIGGTILICQFVMTLAGFGHHDVDFSHDVSLGHDLTVDGHDSHGHGSTWLFSVVSFRTLVAAATFFGLGGLASRAAGLTQGAQITTALVCGVAAMYGTHWIIRQFSRLGEDGTVRIGRAIGQEATVYLSIPPACTAAGKVQIKLQDRLMEYEAVTDHDAVIATGNRVVVIGVEGGQRLKVEPVRQQVPVQSSS